MGESKGQIPGLPPSLPPSHRLGVTGPSLTPEHDSLVFLQTAIRHRGGNGRRRRRTIVTSVAEGREKEGEGEEEEEEAMKIVNVISFDIASAAVANNGAPLLPVMLCSEAPLRKQDWNSPIGQSIGIAF